MEKTLIKIFSVMLVVVITLTSAPLSGFVGLELPEWLDLSIKSSAAETSGTCGTNVTWKFDESTGTLTISGTGAMNDYYYYNQPWSSYKDSIKTVVINDGVTSIGVTAFFRYESLTSIVLPDSVTTIDYYAFADCDSLTSVTIGDSVTTIGEDAFGGCDNITNITVDSNNQYYSSDEYGVLFNKNKTTLIQYPAGNTRTSYTIPDSVTSIINSAFSGCDSLTSVTIPDSVTSIGDETFIGCTSLTSVTIPDSVTSIGNSAFYGCDSLTSVTIPDSVTTIGNEAFRSCTSLTSITIPDSVTTIGKSAFNGCKSLTSATIGDSVTTIGYYVFYHCDSLTSVTIGDGVTKIGEYSFSYCKSLTSVTIPDSVIIIDDYAFEGCTSLTSVTIGDSVTTIGEEAFFNCDSLTSVTIGDSVTTIGKRAFCGCDSLTSVTIPDSVIIIDDYAFEGCTSLTSVTIGDSVTTIGEYAFEACKSLTSITIPDSVTTIESYAFKECTSLTSITIPDSVTSIGYNAFYYCKSLTSVTIPDSVTSIGYDAFYNTAYYNDSSNWENDVLYINNHLIKAKTSLSGDYEIKEGTISIASYAFEACKSLTSITIPDSVTSIGYSAFEACESLSSITILDSVISIGNNAFYNTAYYSDSSNWENDVLYINNHLIKAKTSLSGDYEIKEGTISIASYAFEECTSLTSVTIPDSVTTIGECAFYNCQNLTSVTIGDSVTTVCAGAFYYCKSLTSVTIPDSVTSIGYMAFYGCESITVDVDNQYFSSDEYGVLFNKDKTTLIQYPIGNTRTSYTIPDSVTTIGEDAFYYCKSLTNVTIPDSVTTIGECAFYNCKNLTNVTIGDSVTTVCAGAFYCCTKLRSVTIPDSVTTIDYVAFYECNSLTDVYYSGTEAQWKKVVIGKYNVILETATIHFNSTGGSTEPETPKPEDPDTNENKYIGIVTTEHSLTVGVKEKFNIAFNMIEDGKLVDNWKKMSVVVSNPSIISLSDYKQTDHGFMLEVTGKEPGVTNVVVTDTETGINTTFEIGVYDKYGQTRTYDMKNMPLFTKGVGKIPTSIYDMNGLYVNNFDYKEDGEYYNVTFDVYNEQCSFGAVDIFDKNGVWVGCEKIEPNKQIESMWDWLEKSYYLITDVATGKFIEYTSDFFSKKTEIDIKVPVGGYFTISNNFEASRGASIYLFCELFTKAVGKILPSLGVKATEDQFMRDIVTAIVDEAYQVETLKAACSVLTGEAIKLFTKFSLSNVIDTSVEMVNLFENFLNALDISWKHLAKMTVSGAEKVLTEMFTSIGTPLKSAFTASEINNWYEIFDNVYGSLNNTYASIYTDMDNIKNPYGVEVLTNGEIDVETTLQVFKIFNNKSAEENAHGKKYELYNISFVKNDKTVQPSGLVEVRIPIPKGMKKDSCEIHRQEEDGSWTILTARVEGNYLVFETDHFSLYMITGDMYSLNIQSLPDKLTYTQGEIFDSTGLVLELNGEYITEGLVASPSVMETVGTQKVQIYYGAQYVEIDVEVVSPEPEYNYSFYIQKPSRTKIRNMDGIYLYAVIDGNAPEGSYIEWDRSNTNFITGDEGDGVYLIVADDKGYTTFTATLYDADGNALATESIEMYSDSGFFAKIGGFFRLLFGTTKIHEN